MYRLTWRVDGATVHTDVVDLVDWVEHRIADAAPGMYAHQVRALAVGTVKGATVDRDFYGLDLRVPSVISPNGVVVSYLHVNATRLEG